MTPFTPQNFKIGHWEGFGWKIFLCFFHRFSPGPTGIKGATDQMLPWKAPNDPKTIPMGKLREYLSCWTTLGPFHVTDGEDEQEQRILGGARIPRTHYLECHKFSKYWTQPPIKNLCKHIWILNLPSFYWNHVNMTELNTSAFTDGDHCRLQLFSNFRWN